MALLPLRYVLIIKPAGIEPLLLPVGALVPPQRCFYLIDGHLRMGKVIEVNTIDSCATAPAPILNHGCINDIVATVGVGVCVGIAAGCTISPYDTVCNHSDPSGSVDEDTLPVHGVEPAGTPTMCADLPGGIPLLEIKCPDRGSYWLAEAARLRASRPASLPITPPASLLMWSTIPARHQADLGDYSNIWLYHEHLAPDDAYMSTPCCTTPCQVVPDSNSSDPMKIT
jgi:hypothetical protein